MAIGSSTFDPLVYDFVKFMLGPFSALYLQSGALSPMTYTPEKLPNDAPLYAKIVGEIPSVALHAVPWDTQLDPKSNTLCAAATHAPPPGQHHRRAVPANG